MFGLSIVCYLFLGGAGAGACFVGALLGLLVPRSCVTQRIARTSNDIVERFGAPLEYRALLAPLFACGMLALVLGIACLAVDLGRADRVALLLFQPQFTFVTVGAYALVACVIVASTLALVWGDLVRGAVWWAVVALEVLALACSFVVMVYTGLLLQSLNAVPLWTSWCLPVLFVASSLSCGIVFAVGVARLTGSLALFRSVFRRMMACDALVIVIEAVAMVLLVTTVSASASSAGENATTLAAAQSIETLLHGPDALVFWIGFVAIGIVVSFVWDISCALLARKACGGEAVWATCVLIGGFCMRYCVVMAGLHPIATAGGMG